MKILLKIWKETEEKNVCWHETHCLRIWAYAAKWTNPVRKLNSLWHTRVDNKFPVEEFGYEWLPSITWEYLTEARLIVSNDFPRTINGKPRHQVLDARLVQGVDKIRALRLMTQISYKLLIVNNKQSATFLRSNASDNSNLLQNNLDNSFSCYLIAPT